MELIGNLQIVFSSSEKEIAERIKKYFIQKEIPVILSEISTDKILDENYEAQLFNVSQNSDLIIPILNPIQNASQEYNTIRHIYEKVGFIEKNKKAIVFPVYLPSPDTLNEDPEQIRKPQLFFKNISSYFWSNELNKDENLKQFTNQFNILIESIKKEKEVTELKKQALLKSTEDFTKHAIKDLQNREKNFKNISYFWTVISFLSLVVGIFIVCNFAIDFKQEGVIWNVYWSQPIVKTMQFHCKTFS